MALTLWIFFISPLLAMSLCVVAKCCILTHKSWTDRYGKKDEESESDSDDELGFNHPKCRNNRRKQNYGASKSKPQKKPAKISKGRYKSCKAPLLEPFNWDDLFPKNDNENEALYSSGANCRQSQNRRTSRDHLLSRPVINHHSNRYGVFDKRGTNSRRTSYGCYTNYGRRMSTDPESTGHNVDSNRNRQHRNESGCHSDMSRQSANRGASRRSGPIDNNSTRGASAGCRRSAYRNHSNNPEKATHDVNLQNSGVVNSCVQRNNETTAALRYTVNLPPLNGFSTNQPNTSYHTNQVNLENIYTSTTFQLTSSCSSLASSYQQQCFCDSSLHISLRCRQCQTNWLADPAWRSRRSLLAPSSSDSQESERALSIDSKMWHNPTPPPSYDEALNAPERIHRIDFNNDGPPPYNSVYHLNTNTLPFSIATQAIQPDAIR